MKKILLATAMVLAMSATADAARYETGIGYIDSITNMYHYNDPMFGEDHPAIGIYPLADGTEYDSATRRLVGEAVTVDPTDYVEMDTLTDSDWQVVGYGENAADQWRIATQNMNNGMNGNCLLYTSPSPRD